MIFCILNDFTGKLQYFQFFSHTLATEMVLPMLCRQILKGSCQVSQLMNGFLFRSRWVIYIKLSVIKKLFVTVFMDMLIFAV